MPPRTPPFFCNSSDECGPGHCDHTAGQCVCPAGWAGSHCQWSFLAPCRMSAETTYMSCQGFSGVMACECLDRCVSTMGGGAVDHRICFERTDGVVSSVSDMPANLSLVRFFDVSLSRDRREAVEGWRRLSKATIDGARHPAWRSADLVSPEEEEPLPNQRCPRACSHVGSCWGGRGSRPRCRCHMGFRGPTCSRTHAIRCVNRCSHHGRCPHGVCICEAGWSGVDCSLQHGSPPPRAARFAPTYVYPLPSEWSWQFVGPPRLNLFSAARVFTQLLHSRRDAIVSDPEAAALFFVPILPNHIGGNLWDPRHFFSLVVRFIDTRYPYWNRTDGADHVFFTTQVASASCLSSTPKHTDDIR